MKASLRSAAQVEKLDLLAASVRVAQRDQQVVLGHALINDPRRIVLVRVLEHRAPFFGIVGEEMTAQCQILCEYECFSFVLVALRGCLFCFLFDLSVLHASVHAFLQMSKSLHLPLFLPQ